MLPVCLIIVIIKKWSKSLLHPSHNFTKASLMLIVNVPLKVISVLFFLHNFIFHTNANTKKRPLFIFPIFFPQPERQYIYYIFLGMIFLTKWSTIPDSNRSVPLDQSDWRPTSPEALHAVMDICLALSDGLRPERCSSATVNLPCDSTCLELATWPAV